MPVEFAVETVSPVLAATVYPTPTKPTMHVEYVEETILPVGIVHMYPMVDVPMICADRVAVPMPAWIALECCGED